MTYLLKSRHFHLSVVKVDTTWLCVLSKKFNPMNLLMAPEKLRASHETSDSFHMLKTRILNYSAISAILDSRKSFSDMNNGFTHSPHNTNVCMFIRFDRIAWINGLTWLKQYSKESEKTMVDLVATQFSIVSKPIWSKVWEEKPSDLI